MTDSFTYDNGALRGVLLADTVVNTLTAGRIFADELPDVQAKDMPRKAVVISSAGGTGAFGYVPIGYRAKDFKCYAESPYEASRLWSAVQQVLHGIQRQLVNPPGGLGGVLLYDAARVSGPIMLREPETNWPLVFGTFSVLIADEAEV